MVRVGGSLPIASDARVLAATNQKLAEMVREKRFREDLFFRLNIVTIDLPPLRERGSDILLLAEHFLSDFCRRARRAPPEITAAARKRLAEHPWPGNVRELRNLMERLAYLTSGDRIEAEDLAFILMPARRCRGSRRSGPELVRRDRAISDGLHSPHDRPAWRQHEPRGGATRLAPLQFVPQDEPVGHGRARQEVGLSCRDALLWKTRLECRYNPLQSPPGFVKLVVWLEFAAKSLLSSVGRAADS